MTIKGEEEIGILNMETAMGKPIHGKGTIKDKISTEMIIDG
jgi:hypothetical protein